MPFAIDPEVRDLLPPAPPGDDELLRHSLESEGCRDPLVLGTYPGLEQPILIDGHRRHHWCEKLEMTYRVNRPIQFDSREALLQWVANNQLARRNLTDEQRAYFRGKDYLLSKPSQGGIQ